ncbi:MAG: site-specific integrase [Polyangiaceae bacterium]|nr:site-specific integrase [Polyangiaceae bacterium]
MASRHGKAYRARWTDEHGERQSECFHFKRDADLFQLRKKAEVEEIKNGLRAGLPPKHTFDELANYWLEKRAVRKRSKKDDESIIRKHLRPTFGKLNVRDIGVEDVDDYINARDHLTEKTLANHVTLLASMLRLATTFKVPWVAFVPKFNKPKVALFSLDYQYLRSEDEIRRFLAAARDEGELVFALYSAALYTGLRAGELAGLQWGDVNFETRLITVQRSFTGPTKSNRVRHVPILDALLPPLRAWRLKCPGLYVFPNQANAMHTPSARVFQEVLHRVLERAGLPKVQRNGRERPYITFHGLRHSFASHWCMRGGDIFRLQRILGHQTVMMTMRYSHLTPNVFVEDYERFKVLAIGPGEVIPIAVSTANNTANVAEAWDGTCLKSTA